MDNSATQTSSNADDRAVETGPAEETPRYWLRKRKHNPSSERQPRAKRASKSDNGATQTSSNADDRAVERGAAEGTTRYWLQKRKEQPSSERQPRGKRARKSDPMKCSDPMVLPDVVDNILEFLDSDTLLTSRLVCQQWKIEITQRNGLWRRRCELLGAHKPDKTFAPETDFFSVYMGFKSMLGQISRGEGWRADDACDASQCLVHDHLAKCNEIIEREGREDWVSNLVPDFMVKQRVERKIILTTRHGELVVLDDEEKKVAWRTERNTTAYFILYKDVIFTITLLGNIEVYSWDGRCAVTDTGGKLQGVQEIHVDRTNLFLLVLLRDGRVFLVDDERPMLPLHLPSPPLPEPRDGEESAAAEPINGVHTRVNVDHSGDDGERKLAVAVERQSSMSFVTFTQTGDVLHRLFLKCDRLFEFSPALEAGEGRYRLVSLNGWQVVARSVHVSSKGISVEQLWKRAVPAALQPRMLVAGQKFLICYDGSAFQVYRMDDGTLVADFSAFLNGRRPQSCVINKTGCHSCGIAKAVQLVYSPDMIAHEGGSDMMCILNYDWLDGLSASTMRPDYPVAVMFSTETPRWVRCLRWSEGLWGGNSPPDQQTRDPAGDGIAAD